MGNTLDPDRSQGVALVVPSDASEFAVFSRSHGLGDQPEMQRGFQAQHDFAALGDDSSTGV